MARILAIHPRHPPRRLWRGIPAPLRSLCQRSAGCHGWEVALLRLAEGHPWMLPLLRDAPRGTGLGCACSALGAPEPALAGCPQ